MLLAATTATAQNRLEAVDIDPLPGGQLQLRFRLSQPPATPPGSFTINNPARIVVDFPNIRNGLSNRQLTIGSGVAERLTVLEAAGRTRASLSLSRLPPYRLRSEGSDVVLTLEAGAAPPPPRAETRAGPAPAGLPRGSIGNLDFRRSPDGGAVISVRMSNPAIPVDVRQEGNLVVADFQGAQLPAGQQRRLDVSDFATPVTQVDALNRGDSARITIRPRPPFEFLAYQADDLFTIEVKPPQRQEEEAPAPGQQRTYTGDLLSLNFQNIDVRAVLQIIADFTGQNVVVSDTVQGSLTLRLQNVPWDQALDIILRTKGLTLRQSGNVMYIAPTEEVAARERLELEARKTKSELEPLRTEVIQINYAKATEMANLLKAENGGAGGAGAGAGGSAGGASRLLSPRGQVSVDSRTNSLLVQDTSDKLTEIRNLVTRLDRPVRQVLIDSRVVIANDDFSKELGIRWGGAIVRTNDNGIIGVTGSLRGTNTMVNSAISNLNNTGRAGPVTLPQGLTVERPFEDRIGVNLPVTNPFGQVAVAILGKNFLVDMELSALQSEGRGEILSNPRVVTADRAQANILQGREIPYLSTSANTGPTVTFKDAILQLLVTPQITPDDRIIMDLNVKKDDVGQLVPTGIGGVVPSIDRREIETQVLVNNGDTIVLGGVFEQTKTNSVDKVPFLGDLPAIGRLFRKNTDNDIKRELLIFVTPQIIREGAAASR